MARHLQHCNRVCKSVKMAARYPSSSESDSDLELSPNDKILGIEIQQSASFVELETIIQRLRENSQWNDDLQLVAALRRAELRLESYSASLGVPSLTVSRKPKSAPRFVYRGRYVTLRQIKRVKCRQFRTEARDFQVHFNKEMTSSDREDILSTVFAGMTEILTYLFQNYPRETYGRFVIISQYFDKPVSVRMQEIKQITPTVIFSELEKVIQSKKEFVLDEHVRIHLLTCTPPAGSGKRSGSHLDSDDVFSKRSCKEVCKDKKDYLCLAKALVLGRALCNFPTGSKTRHMYLDGVNSKKYEEEVKNLHKEAGIPIEARDYTLNDVAKFQKYLREFKIYVFEKLKGTKCIFADSSVSSEKRIYLFLRNKHFHIITAIDPFLPHKYKFCHHCVKIYHKSSTFKHYSCKSVCALCLHQSCDSQVVLQRNDRSWEECEKCRRYFPGTLCYENHKLPGFQKTKSACDQHVKCTTCGKIVLRLQMGNHVCHSIFCKLCKKEYLKGEEHVCYIRKKILTDIDIQYGGRPDYTREMMKKSKRLFFFDIETEIVEGSHEAILLIMQDEGGNEKAFYGKDCIREFCREIFTTAYRNSLFLSHGGRNYDNYFPLKYCQDNNIVPDIIFNGSQILQLHIPKYGITFKDNLYFLCRPLSELPKTMGLNMNVAKGFFPYKLPFPHTRNFFVKGLPPREKFCSDTMKITRREEFEKWYSEREQKEETFDYFSELCSYCSQDVRILRQAAMKFRELIILHGMIDPYVEALTLAHLCSQIYTKMFMKEKSIAIIPHYGFKNAKMYSVKSIKFFEYLIQETGKYIRHQLNGGEKKIMGEYYVDGFIEPTKDCSTNGTILEFAGCFFHGHFTHYNSNGINHVNGKTFGDLYAALMDRKRMFEENNFRVEIYWECEFDRRYMTDDSFKRYIDSVPIVEKLEPGNALYGGRNEVFSLYRKVAPSEKILYQDIMSLYPSVMHSEIFPVGAPTSIELNPSIHTLGKAFGLASVEILAPKDLPVGMLPFREKKGEKIFYPLCRTCCMLRQTALCTHAEEQRSFRGVYTTFELNLAITKGYKVSKCFELWHWDEMSRSDSLFKGYIETFFKLKLCCEGFPTDVQTISDRVKYCEKLSEANGFVIKPSEVEKNDSLRHVCKAICNNLWGKFSLRPGKSKTKYITQPSEYYDMLRNDRIEIDNVWVVSQEMIHVSYTDKDKMPSSFTNVVLACMVTSYARCKLFRTCIEPLKPEQLLYVDTDSVIYSAKEDEKILTCECKLGALTDELAGHSIMEWCATGNKSYSYRVLGNSSLDQVKVKGFTLKLAANERKDVNFKLMVEMVMNHPNTTLELTQPPLFVKDVAHSRIYTKDRSKLFAFNYDNKVVACNYQTKPYGFRGQYPLWRSEDM